MAPRSASSTAAAAAAAAAESSSAAASSSSSSSSAAAPATRLDPSLFRSYFTQPPAPKSILKSTPADPRTPSEIAEERRRARAAARRVKERKGGVVQGRDGRPMKRLKDGRTVVRALESGGGEGEGGEGDGEEGETERLARRRGDRFVGHKLGLRGGDGDDKPKKAASSGSSSSKSARNDDDPLGLGDPAFLPGGQFAHLANLTGKANRRKKTRSSSSKKVVTKSQQRGAATRSALPFGGARPAMAFARASK